MITKNNKSSNNIIKEYHNKITLTMTKTFVMMHTPAKTTNMNFDNTFTASNSYSLTELREIFILVIRDRLGSCTQMQRYRDTGTALQVCVCTSSFNILGKHVTVSLFFVVLGIFVAVVVLLHVCLFIHSY